MTDGWINGCARGEWPELMRRARISLAWEKPARRRAQRKLIKAQMHDPEFEARRVAGVRASNAERIEALRKLGGRFHPNHPHPPLPPMSPQERRRYRYLRTMADRATALEAIMIERGTRS